MKIKMKVYCDSCKNQVFNEGWFVVIEQCALTEHISSGPNRAHYTYKRCSTVNAKNDCKNFDPSLWFKIKRKFQR